MGKVIKYWYKSIPQELQEVLGSSKFKVSLGKLEKKEFKDADRILTLTAKEIFVNANLFDRQKAKEFLKANLFNTLLKNKGINKMNFEDFKSKKEIQEEKIQEDKKIITIEEIFQDAIEDAQFRYDNTLNEEKEQGRDISQKLKKDSTVKQYSAVLKHLKSFFGDNKNIKEIQKNDIKRFQRFLSEKGMKPKSLNLYIRQSKTIFEELVEDKILDLNPFSIKRLKENNDTKEMFSNEDIKLILSKLEGDFKLAFEIGIYSGMRISEIFDIKIKNINEDILFIPWAKGGKKRDTVFHKNINLNYDLIKELKINKNENQYLIFKDTLTNRLYVQNQCTDLIKKILTDNINFKEKTEEEIKEELALIDKKTFHGTRASFRTFLENTKTKDSFVNDLMGHSQKGVGNKNYVKNRDINIKREIINSIHYSIRDEASKTIN